MTAARDYAAAADCPVTWENGHAHSPHACRRPATEHTEHTEHVCACGNQTSGYRSAGPDYAAAAEVLEGLGQAVRERREALGLTTHELAEQLTTVGWSGVLVDKVEHGDPLSMRATVAFLRWLARTSEEADRDVMMIQDWDAGDHDQHEILFRQISRTGASAEKEPFSHQAVCACGWESDKHLDVGSVDEEVAGHLKEAFD